MLGWLGSEVSPAGVVQLYAERYPALLDGFVVDRQDETMASRIDAFGMRVLVADTVMDTDARRAALAREVLDWGERLPRLA